ncbi:hypothetical protein [Actinomyces lilanjuaniae]|uniref:hypothetical protein n=1 Tax=Actinomyces lilanjuaniae TaxID=2321394 RepID=UPI0013C50A95|nr:hypothetical protein [Actinomyces lilanjuaniae]
MTTSDSTGAQGRSPLTRPGFIAATALVVVIAVVAAALALANTMSSREGTAAAGESASTEATGPVEIPPPSTAGPDHDGTQSVCGLEGEVLGTADLVEAPDVDSWDYQDTMAYPVSAEYGPGATADAGYRYCFQHSPRGRSTQPPTPSSRRPRPTRRRSSPGSPTSSPTPLSAMSSSHRHRHRPPATPAGPVTPLGSACR